ncbi:MAG: alpha-2-macroglobulin, partial [Treponema sp.]|nr:alpha-2-macroglobulin [Treponema sp.]
MKSKTQYILPLIFVSVLIISCSRQADPVAPDVNYVQAVSSGILGRTEPILVEFVHAQDTQAPLAASVFTLHPSARGTLSWLDEFTLAFTPAEPLRGGRRYQARVNLTGIPAFSFDFSVSLPMLAVALEPVMLDANGDAVVRGSVTVDPGTEITHIEAAITSGELGRPRWTHEFGRHIFTFAPITLQAAARTVAVNWNGRSLGSTENGFTSVLIPGTEAFEITGFHMNAGVLEVSFSAPLRTNSDLRGFITMDGNTNIRYQIERNIVRVFGDGTGGIPPGTEIIIQDIADINGRVLAVPVQHRIPERWELPQVRFAGTGNILPTTQGSQLVIETRNISGVLVEAFRIHGNNMLQFLQVNNLSGDRELDRVGEPVWTSAIDFGWSPMDQNRWVRRGLDLSELSRRYPDSMFRIRVSFRQRHIHFECAAEHGSFANLTFPDDSFPTVLPWDARQPSFWDNFHRMPGFNWSDWHRFRRDPCHPSFFFSHWDHDITIGRNVLVSDLGLMAKRDMEGSWLIVTTNIVTAQPARGVDFRIHNFQGRVLAHGRTGADGIAFLPHFTVTPQDNRFFISAESDLGRAYLRVQDALALATSHFDVAGGPPSTGIRGLIYGERGVWRPGDDIFLTFLLSDPQQTLPPNHPVTLEFEDPRGRLVVQQTHTSSVDGFFRMAVSTAPDAPTGNWTARVRVGGNVFTRLVRVE